MATCCKGDKERSNSINGGEILYQFNDCKLTKKSTPYGKRETNFSHPKKIYGPMNPGGLK
jgi:hypothetical protein